MPVFVKELDTGFDTSKYTGPIVSELSSETSDPTAPVIIEEHNRRGSFMIVTVIWDGWDQLEPEARGNVILDAYQQARGIDVAASISIATGLTHAEADRFGIKP